MVAWGDRGGRVILLHRRSKFQFQTSLPYCRATQIAIWVAIITGVVLGMHVVLTILARWRRWHLPSFLEFPRLELFLALFLASPIAQAAGREYPNKGLSCRVIPSRYMPVFLTKSLLACQSLHVIWHEFDAPYITINWFGF